MRRRDGEQEAEQTTGRGGREASSRHRATGGIGADRLHPRRHRQRGGASGRGGAGRLSEVIGDVTVDTDRFTRTLCWHRAAEKELATLPPDTGAALQAYCDGVNAFLDSHQDSLPVEFTILGYKPEHWAPVDI